MEKPDLSLCMIVRDEEEHLDRCLRSAAHLVREIIVVDTGSRDASRKIAAGYGAEIIDYPWDGDFSRARNAGLRKAKSSWILVLDADEELAEADPKALMPLLQQDEVYGWHVRMIHYIGERPGQTYAEDMACRLFRNDSRIAYEGRIHEDIEASILALGASRIACAPLVIRHYGYLDGALAGKKKAQRNIAILREVIGRHPDDARMRYALGTEHFLEGNYKEALKWFRPLIGQTPAHAGYASDLALKTVHCLHKTGRAEEALQLADEALLLYPDYADLWELKAVLCKQAHRLTEALAAAEQAVKAGTGTLRYATVSGSGTYRSHYLAGAICERLLRFDEAVRHYRQAVEFEPEFSPAWARWARIAFGTNQAGELLALAAEKGGALSEPVKRTVLEAAVDAGNKAECAFLLGLPGFADHHPVLQAMLRIRLGNEKEAASLLQQIPGVPEHGTERLLCLWALAMKHSETDAAANILNQIAELDPLFRMKVSSSDAPARCQQALIRCGAWEAWIGLIRSFQAQRAEWHIPVGSLYSLLDAPERTKRDFTDVCRAWGEHASFSERLAAGALAHSEGEIGAAIFWFQSARSLAAGSLEPLAGLAACHADLANARYGTNIFTPSIPPRLLLLGSYM